MSIALSGFSEIVFTGGMGEHDSRGRATACARLSSLGVDMDEDRNAVGQGVVSCDGAR